MCKAKKKHRTESDIFERHANEATAATRKADVAKKEIEKVQKKSEYKFHLTEQEDEDEAVVDMEGRTQMAMLEEN